MSTIFQKVLLTGAPDGRQITVAGTVAPGVTIHTPSNTAVDEVWLYAANNGTNIPTLSIQWGGQTGADLGQTVIQPQVGRQLIADGRVMTGAGPITAFASAGTIFVDGFVNRLTTDMDPWVLDWVARVVLNGGATPSLATQQILSIFCQQLRAANLLQKMVMINCFVPDSLTACMTPLIHGTGYDSWINHNFVSGDVTVNGITGDGSSKYADTGIQSASAFNGVLASLGLTLYCYANPTSWTGNQEDLLTYDGGTNQLALLVDFNGASYFDVFAESSGSGRVTTNNPAFRGYISGNYGTLDGSITEALYVASPQLGGHKTLVSAVGSTAGTLSNLKIFFGTGNQTGTPVSTSYCNKTYSFAAAHYGLKAAESQALYTLVQNLRQGLGGGYVNSDPGADWANRVVFNGGAMPSANTQSALNTFYKSLVSANILSKMLMINIIAPDSLTAALTPFWNYNGGNDPWINHGFVSGDLTVNGLIGNGSSKYLDTGFVSGNSFISNTNGGFTIYTSVNTTNTADADFYCAQAAGQASGLLVNQGSGGAGSSFLDCYAQTPGSGRISASNPTWTGYLSGNAGVLDGSIIAAIYKANSGVAHTTLVSSTTSSGGTQPTIPLFAYADNANGSPALFTNKRYSLLATHSGLIASESLAFYNAIQALRTALGGGFV